MWSWKVVMMYKGTNEKTTIIGSEYPDEKKARTALAFWLRRILPGMYLYQLDSVDVVYVPKKEGG